MFSQSTIHNDSGRIPFMSFLLQHLCRLVSPNLGQTIATLMLPRFLDTLLDLRNSDLPWNPIIFNGFGK